MTNPQRTGVSPVRAALDKANRVTRERELITPDQYARVGRLLFWRIVLAPYVARYEGTIEMPELVEQAEKVSNSLGRVVSIGHFAFQSKTVAGLDLSKEPNIPKVGEYVLHELYAGTRVKLRGDREIRIINETDILMVVDDPDEIRGYL